MQVELEAVIHKVPQEIFPRQILKSYSAQEEKWVVKGAFIDDVQEESDHMCQLPNAMQERIDSHKETLPLFSSVRRKVQQMFVL